MHYTFSFELVECVDIILLSCWGGEPFGASIKTEQLYMGILR